MTVVLKKIIIRKVNEILRIGSAQKCGKYRHWLRIVYYSSFGVEILLFDICSCGKNPAAEFADAALCIGVAHFALENGRVLFEIVNNALLHLFESAVENIRVGERIVKVFDKLNFSFVGTGGIVTD